ncbi:hypothetical protein BX600DRAFT_441197 [Xylariales sp. PMI_506]|nr:hypothetical protein BX600DRAFT_441197 [Xylariales sp. PMI_506]
MAGLRTVISGIDEYKRFYDTLKCNGSRDQFNKGDLVGTFDNNPANNEAMRRQQRADARNNERMMYSKKAFVRATTAYDFIFSHISAKRSLASILYAGVMVAGGERSGGLHPSTIVQHRGSVCVHSPLYPSDYAEPTQTYEEAENAPFTRECAHTVMGRAVVTAASWPVGPVYQHTAPILLVYAYLYRQAERGFVGTRVRMVSNIKYFVTGYSAQTETRLGDGMKQDRLAAGEARLLKQNFGRTKHTSGDLFK